VTSSGRPVRRDAEIVVWALRVEADFRPARKAHLALLVTDLPELQAKLEASGYILKDDEPLEGFRRVYVDDPFGNRVELMEPN
jgi:catechol 2,3-dioxygenase-like lactoylglutathione lyase family enzyme